MNCSKCGMTNNSDAKFCGSCGAALSITQTQNINENNQEVETLDKEVTEPVIINQPQMAPEVAMPTNNAISNQPITEPVVQSNAIAQTSVDPQQAINNQPMNQNMNTTQIVNQPLSTNNLSQVPSPKKSSNKKIFIILVIAAIAIVGAGIGLFNLFSSEEIEEKKKINSIFNPDQLIRVKKGDKYGYIDTDGKFVINAAYEEATSFRGDYAVVRGDIEIDGLKTTASQIIDKKGKVQIQVKENVDYIESLDLWVIDEELYNNSLKKISPTDVRVEYEDEGYFVWVNSKTNTGGIMNEKGKQTYTYKFLEGESYISIDPSENDESLKERYCRINIENEKYAIVNCDTGVVVQDFTEKYISDEDDNIFELSDHDTFDFISIMYIQNDKILYQSESESIDLYYYPGYVRIRDDNKSYEDRYTYLHTETGEIKTDPPRQNETTDNEEKLDEWEMLTKNKKFSCTTGYGLMNDDQVTLPCEWQSLVYLEINLYKYLKDEGKDYIYGEKNNKWYLIDLKTKKPIIEFNASYITQKEGTTYMYYTDQDTRNIKVYNLVTGKTLNVNSSSSLSVYSNYITVREANINAVKYYNTNLKLIYTENL